MRLGVTVVGVGLGLGVFMLIEGALAGLLFGIEPSDPLVLGGTALLVVVTGVAASRVPALRVIRAHPRRVLMSDGTGG